MDASGTPHLQSRTAPLPQRRFDLVMFDLDGTLIDTAPEIALALSQVLAELELPPAPEEWVRRWIGGGSRLLIEGALAWACPDRVFAADEVDVIVERYWAVHEQHCGTRSRPFDGARECLAALAQAGVACAVVSNKEQRLVEQLLDCHRLRDSFDLVVGGDTLTAKKPDPLPVQHCLQALDVAADRALLVGDALVDLECARAAGVECWIVRHGYEAAAAINAASPDRIIADYTALMVPVAD